MIDSKILPVLSSSQIENCQQWSMPSVSGGQHNFLKASSYTDELEKIKADAKAEGYERGRQEGMAAAEQQIKQLTELFTVAITLLESPISRMDQQLETTFFELITVMTQQCVGHEMTTNPDAIKSMLQKVCELLPKSNETVKVTANQADISLLEEAIKHANITIKNCSFIASEQLQRGEIIAETPQTKIDATVMAQMQSLAEKSLQEL